MIDVNSSLSGDGRGLSADSGLGAGIPGGDGSGAGYGGAGANSSADGGGTYGSITQPTDLGSGGGTSTANGAEGRRGGGVIRLTVGGTLTVDGQITADGSGADSDAGSGSGGSIWIETSDFDGFGFVSADGGRGGDNSFSDGLLGGCGGGGRIAIYVSGTSSFIDENIRAFGGNASRDGGAGTVYYQRSGDVPPDLIIDNADNTAGEFTELTGSITIPGDLIIRDAGKLGHDLEDDSLHLNVARNLIIDPNSIFSVNSRGFGSGEGQGAGNGGANAGGGGYGGNGGNGSSSDGGIAYGSESEPIDLGSGGGFGPGTCVGGRGGGAIRVSVGGTMTINGTVSADGGNGTSGGCNGGGGSGGSIWITACELGGFGFISSTGGNGPGGAGGGSGGRIAIYSLDPANPGFTGSIESDGSDGGEDGTLFFGKGCPDFEILLGDVNCDGQVNLLDVGPFVDLITSGAFLDKADINQDGSVNLLDVGPFVALLTGG